MMWLYYGQINFSVFRNAMDNTANFTLWPLSKKLDAAEREAAEKEEQFKHIEGEFHRAQYDIDE